MFVIDDIISELVSQGVVAVQERLNRNETVQKLLKQDEPPNDFEVVYVYTLVEYSVGKPKPILELFRQQEIQEAFRKAFGQNNPSILLKEVEDYIEGYAVGDEIKEQKIDYKREFVEFSALFIEIAKRARTLTEILQARQIDKLQDSLVAIREQLHSLNTLEEMWSAIARLAQSDQALLPPSYKPRETDLAQQMRGWFKALRYDFEPYEVREDKYFEWIINIPARRGYDRILVRGIEGEAGINDVMAVRQGVKKKNTDEGWLVAPLRIGSAARDEVKKDSKLFCYTFDELLDEVADFSGYLKWLEDEVEQRKINQMYVPLACTKEEIDPDTKQRIAVNRYDERDDCWIDGYINRWLDDPAKEHISILGEFGTGKTWFAFHYACTALQRYRQDKERGGKRPRLPLLIPLRDYAKAVSVESLFSEFFFRKHEIPLPGYSAFEQLNRMGKLLLIFDGFDEMAARVDLQAMINNFWELAKVVVPGSKAILTCRTEHFPEAKEGRALLNAELKASTANLTGEPPQFEVLELEKFNDDQIRKVLSFRTEPATIEKVMGNPQLLDLARRPLMTELILEALPDIEAGKPVDISRIYLYAVRRKMERDIKTERTFTSMADKLYFLCELSWEMLSTDKMSLNYRLFPERIRRLFGAEVQEQKDLDHWHFDMMGQTILIRNSEGDYTPAHRSLLEFFVAYKFAAELGVLASDFTEVAQAQSHLDKTVAPQNYIWVDYFQRQIDEEGKIVPIPALNFFVSEDIKVLCDSFGKAPLAKVVLDLLLPMLNPAETNRARLVNIIEATGGKTEAEVGYIGGNAATLLLKINKAALEGKNLMRTVLKGADFANASLCNTNFANAYLVDCTFTETFGNVLSVAFNSNRKLLAAGDAKGEINLWQVTDVKNFKKLPIYKGHTNRVWSVAFSSDGTKIASGSEDRTVIIWDVETGQCLHSLEGQERVWSVAFSPDGRKIASGSEDRTVKLWDVETGQCLRTLEGHAQQVRSVAFSPDGRKIASGSEDRTVRLWDVKMGQCLRTLEGHAQQVWSVAFSPDGKKIASASEDQTIKLWDVETGQCLHSLEGHTNRVWSVAFGCWDGQAVASGGEDQTIKLWDMETGKCFKTWYAYANRVWSVAFSPDGTKIASGGDDRTVRIWDVKTNQCLRTLEGHTNWILSVAFSPDGTKIVSASDDRTVRIWDVETGQCLRTLKGHDKRVWSVAFSSDGTQIVSGSNDQKVRIWDVETGQCLRTLEGHAQKVRSVAFSPDGTQIVSASDDRTVRIWDVETGQCLRPLEGHTNRVWSVAFSPDGTKIASGSDDQTVKIWDVETGQCLRTLEGHTHWIRSLIFSPDGLTIASSSEDETIRFWDVKTGKEIKQWQTARPYAGMNITGVTGLTEAQKATLKALGAKEELKVL